MRYSGSYFSFVLAFVMLAVFVFFLMDRPKLSVIYPVTMIGFVCYESVWALQHMSETGHVFHEFDIYIFLFSGILFYAVLLLGVLFGLSKKSGLILAITYAVCLGIWCEMFNTFPIYLLGYLFYDPLFYFISMHICYSKYKAVMRKFE